MAKAVWITDMPTTCLDCRLWARGGKYPDGLCRVNGKYAEINQKPGWCPLIPEPPQATPDNSDMSIEWNLGWNACLDYLDGKSK